MWAFVSVLIYDHISAVYSYELADHLRSQAIYNFPFCDYSRKGSLCSYWVHRAKNILGGGWAQCALDFLRSRLSESSNCTRLDSVSTLQIIFEKHNFALKHFWHKCITNERIIRLSKKRSNLIGYCVLFSVESFSKLSKRVAFQGLVLTKIFFYFDF